MLRASPAILEACGSNPRFLWIKPSLIQKAILLGFSILSEPSLPVLPLFFFFVLKTKSTAMSSFSFSFLIDLFALLFYIAPFIVHSRSGSVELEHA